MHGMENVKFVNAEQAKPIYDFKDIKGRLCKTNTSGWYNKVYVGVEK